MPLEPHELERRPNPPGWVQPKAPYNPYDPTDLRPPGGYPSEFSTPGVKKKFTGKVAKDTTDFSRMRIDMKRLEYYPKPMSELYPGRYKVLRRVKYMSRFDKGAIFTGRVAMYSFAILGVFFYKWNDYDHMLARFRRFQLRVKGYIMGELSDEDYNDLFPKEQKIPQKAYADFLYDHLNGLPRAQETPVPENDIVRTRLAYKHVNYTEHLFQAEAEKRLRAKDKKEQEELDILNGVKPNKSNEEEKPKGFWRLWR